MSTLADELLQDFEGSGSEAGEDLNEDFFNEAGLPGATAANGEDTAMEEVRDEDEDEDQEMQDGDANGLGDESGEDAKAKIEKMQLGGIKDVRSVATLMKTLTPVLEVSTPPAFTCRHHPV